MMADTRGLLLFISIWRFYLLLFTWIIQEYRFYDIHDGKNQFSHNRTDTESLIKDCKDGNKRVQKIASSKTVFVSEKGNSISPSCKPRYNKNSSLKKRLMKEHPIFIQMFNLTQGS